MTTEVRDGVLAGYDSGEYFCEMLGRADAPAGHTAAIRRQLAGHSLGELKARAQAAERELFNLGITFTLYSGATTIDRILPFDVIPRVISPADWQVIESGVVQRVTAIHVRRLVDQHRVDGEDVVPDDGL